MSKKTQVAKLILSMTTKERIAMASDIVEMQSNAEDDGSGFSLDNKLDVSLLLREWAKGLGSME